MATNHPRVAVLPVLAFLLLCLLGAGCRSVDTAILEAHLDVELRTASPEALDLLWNELGTPPGEPDGQPRLELWRVWRTSEPGDEGFVVFEGCGGVVKVPSCGFARVRSFDLAGARTGTWSFSTGSRRIPIDASLFHSTKLGGPVLAISTSRFPGAPANELQYYSLRDHDLRLVRMQTTEGALRQNFYHRESSRIGPSVRRRTTREWREDLESDDPVRILAASTFLAGDHCADQWTQGTTPNHESIISMRAYDALRVDTSVRARLEFLRDSENSWVRDAVSFAIEQIDARALSVR